MRAGRTVGKAGPAGGANSKCERQDDTKTFTSDDERKIEPRQLAAYCRSTVLEWVRSKAADTSFQPTGAQDLVGVVAAACSHLLHAIPEVQTSNTYAQVLMKHESSVNNFKGFEMVNPLRWKVLRLWHRQAIFIGYKYGRVKFPCLSSGSSQCLHVLVCSNLFAAQFSVSAPNFYWIVH